MQPHISTHCMHACTTNRLERCGPIMLADSGPEEGPKTTPQNGSNTDPTSVLYMGHHHSHMVTRAACSMFFAQVLLFGEASDSRSLSPLRKPCQGKPRKGPSNKLRMPLGCRRLTSDWTMLQHSSRKTTALIHRRRHGCELARRTLKH